VISGIVHMLKIGGCWRDCPACYGASSTIDNGDHR
jgi:transposase